MFQRRISDALTDYLNNLMLSIFIPKTLEKREICCSKYRRLEVVFDVIVVNRDVNSGALLLSNSFLAASEAAGLVALPIISKCF